MGNWKEKLKMRLPAALLLAATVLFWGFYDRYELAGPVLLDSPSLADATRVRGDCAETNGCFTLAVPAGGKTASINFRLPEAGDFERIRVRGRIKVDGVVEGRFRWRCARLLLIQYDENNKWISGHHGVVAERGSKDWKFHKDVFEVDSLAMHADLVILQAGLSGTAEFDRLVAEPVRIRKSFARWRSLFAGLWIPMGVLYFRRCRLHRRKLKLLILLNVLAIFAGTLMPGVWIQDSSQRVKAVVEKALEGNGQPPARTAARKPDRDALRIDQFNEVVGGAHHIGHFGLFASLCFLVYCSAALERQHPVYFLKVGADILLFAAITESLQLLTLDRTAGVLDLLTDVYGMAAAFMLFLIVLPLIRRFQGLENPTAG